MENTTAAKLYNLLVTRDFEPEILDSQGRAVTDPAEAELFSFDYKTPDKNYGTVVALLGTENQLEVYFGDNLGRSMEGDDKQSWYQFLEQMKQFATRNLLTFEINNLNRLKYTMQGMAAIKEGLFEGYYGTRKVSYSDQPKNARLVIRHSRDIAEGEARYRAIESLFVETADGERFRVPSRSLTHGRMLARHVAEGGTPYDAFGQHINEIVSEMHTLSRFVRAARGRGFDGEAAALVEAAVRHYADLKAKAKQMIGQRGYREARDSFDPAGFTDSEVTAEAIRDMFIEQTLDHRIEEALPVLARLSEMENHMKEIAEFEGWADAVTEGTWAKPDTPEAKQQLAALMSRELIVGPDATNATEQLYDILGDDELFDILEDMALTDPDANAWDDPRVQKRMAELGVPVKQPAPATPPATPAQPQQPPTSAAAVEETLVGAPTGGVMPMRMREESVKFEPVSLDRSPPEGAIHTVGNLDVRMLPGFRDTSTSEDYSKTFYYRDPISNGIFSVYAHGGIPRVRGTDGMSEQRVAEIVKTLSGEVSEDLDVDGVMMTRPSNMSSESRERDELYRLMELARG
jgi:hypothetical protein